jgi:hypothetical protein
LPAFARLRFVFAERASSLAMSDMLKCLLSCKTGCENERHKMALTSLGCGATLNAYLLFIDKQGQRCRCSFLIGVFLSVTRVVGLFRFARLAAGLVQRLLNQNGQQLWRLHGAHVRRRRGGCETRVAAVGSQTLITHPKLFQHRLPNEGVASAVRQIIALVLAFIGALLGLCNGNKIMS